MNTPFFTIITATYNASATLPRLLESLVEQTCRDFELIIQDGASCDATVAILESYRERLPALDLVSAPDDGIYDAWNRAIQRVRGEWVIFLGADDQLVDETTLEQVRAKLLPVPQTVLFAAGDIFICDDTGELFIMPGLDKDISGQMKAGEPAVHSGLFQRTAVFCRNRFDTSFRIVGDYEFVTRLWKRDNDGTHLGILVTRMAVGGATSNLYSMLRYRYEKIRVMYRYFGITATLPHLFGLVKGLVPFTLSRVLGPEKAVALYNKLRTLRGMPPAHIK